MIFCKASRQEKATQLQCSSRQNKSNLLFNKHKKLKKKKKLGLKPKKKRGIRPKQRPGKKLRKKTGLGRSSRLKTNLDLQQKENRYSRLQ